MSTPGFDRHPTAIGVHGIVERLTASKLLLGQVRLRLRREGLEPSDVEAVLDRIEQEIDHAAVLARNLLDAHMQSD
jgi:hypothetical protein